MLLQRHGLDRRIEEFRAVEQWPEVVGLMRRSRAPLKFAPVLCS
jgi:hypothetical protein